MKTILSALAIALSAALPAAAQSTDRTRPTAWPAGGLEARGDGRDHVYYYVLEAGPGPGTIRVEGRARAWSTGVAIDLETESGAPLGRGGVIALPGDVTSEATRVSFPERLRVIVRLTIDANVDWYRVRLETAPARRRWDSYGVNGEGGDATRVHEYEIEAGPGELVVHVRARARTVQTAVLVEIADASGAEVLFTGVKPGLAPMDERAAIVLAERRTMVLRITVEPDCGAWSVWIDGPVVR